MSASPRQNAASNREVLTVDQLLTKIAAAKLRVTMDRKLGRITPDWVQALVDRETEIEEWVQSASQEPEKLTRDQLQTKIAAAKLRITMDMKLGKTTPEWVRTLASRKL